MDLRSQTIPVKPSQATNQQIPPTTDKEPHSTPCSFYTEIYRTRKPTFPCPFVLAIQMKPRQLSSRYLCLRKRQMWPSFYKASPVDIFPFPKCEICGCSIWWHSHTSQRLLRARTNVPRTFFSSALFSVLFLRLLFCLTPTRTAVLFHCHALA
jgi:hypothetical protein